MGSELKKLLLEVMDIFMFKRKKRWATSSEVPMPRALHDVLFGLVAEEACEGGRCFSQRSYFHTLGCEVWRRRRGG